MENPTAFLAPMIIVATIFLIIGILLGVLFSGFRSPSDSDVKSGRLKPLLRVWRDIKTQQLLLEVGEDRYASRGQIESERMQMLLKLSVEMRIWLGAVSAAELQTLSSQAQGKPAAEKLVVQPAAPAIRASTLSGAMGKEWEPAQEVKPVSTDISQVITSAVSGKGTKQPSSKPAKTVAGQIDEILQEKLAGSPLRHRDIRLMDDPSGGVVVWVGAQRFDSVSEVTDPEVEALLRQCVRDWEKKNYRE